MECLALSKLKLPKRPVKISPSESIRNYVHPRMSREKFAKLLGLSYATLFKYDNGQIISGMTIDVAKALANAIGEPEQWPIVQLEYSMFLIHKRQVENHGQQQELAI